ncbi:unnamed protein product [Closterium sp. Naga37s-1]|nr:unnamed protein product [Closterium sp. Naga37s-1]
MASHRTTLFVTSCLERNAVLEVGSRVDSKLSSAPRGVGQIHSNSHRHSTSSHPSCPSRATFVVCSQTSFASLPFPLATTLPPAARATVPERRVSALQAAERRVSTPPLSCTIPPSFHPLLLPPLIALPPTYPLPLFVLLPGASGEAKPTLAASSRNMPATARPEARCSQARGSAQPSQRLDAARPEARRSQARGSAQPGERLGAARREARHSEARGSAQRGGVLSFLRGAVKRPFHRAKTRGIYIQRSFTSRSLYVPPVFPPPTTCLLPLPLLPRPPTSSSPFSLLYAPYAAPSLLSALTPLSAPTPPLLACSDPPILAPPYPLISLPPTPSSPSPLPPHLPPLFVLPAFPSALSAIPLAAGLGPDQAAALTRGVGGAPTRAPRFGNLGASGLAPFESSQRPVGGAVMGTGMCGGCGLGGGGSIAAQLGGSSGNLGGSGGANLGGSLNLGGGGGGGGVTIGSCGGYGVVNLHLSSVVLAAKSAFFRTLFTCGFKETCQNNPVVLNVSPEEEGPKIDLLRFIYTGDMQEGSSDPEDIIKMYLVADKFGVASCMKICLERLVNLPMTVPTACLYLSLPDSMHSHRGVAQLLEASRGFLVAHFRDLERVHKGEEFLELPLVGVQTLLASDELNVRDELTAFHAMVEWLRHHHDDLDDRKRAAVRLAEHVRFPLITGDDLEDVVLKALEVDSPECQALVSVDRVYVCGGVTRVGGEGFGVDLEDVVLKTPEVDSPECQAMVRGWALVRQVREAAWFRAYSLVRRLRLMNETAATHRRFWQRRWNRNSVGHVYFDIHLERFQALAVAATVESATFGIGGKRFYLSARHGRRDDGTETLDIRCTTACSLKFRYG